MSSQGREDHRPHADRRYPHPTVCRIKEECSGKRGNSPSEPKKTLPYRANNPMEQGKKPLQRGKTAPEQVKIILERYETTLEQEKMVPEQVKTAL